MRGETGDRDDAAVRTSLQIRQRRARHFMKGRRHHRERAFEIVARQLRKTAAVGKARRMHDAVDVSEGLARCS